jgi:predicted TIM-barrel fold metal-dependent hydrolase
MQRRDFIEKIGGGAALMSGAPFIHHLVDKKNLAGSNLPNSSNLVIEWNAHIFSPDLKKFPFHPKATYQPDTSNQPEDPLAAYLDQLQLRGIDRAVIVHPEPYGDDHRLVLECLERYPEKLRGTSLFYPQDEHAPEKLKALVKREARIVATRFHALKGNEKYLKSFADAGVLALWRQAFDLDLIIELHIGPDYAKQAGDAIRAFPGCKILIDHLAEPHLGTAVQYADVLDLAKFPNVYMKLSGINHFSDDEPYYPSARAFTSRVIKEFGPDRLVWGSGTPDIVDQHMMEYSVVDRDKVKGGNISYLLNWS